MDDDRPPKRRLASSGWSDLPAELCGLILRRLRCHIDRLRFRCVCRHWRQSERQHRALLPPALPLICTGDHSLLSVPGGELRRCGADHVDALLHVFATCDGCFDGWLLFQRHDYYGRRACLLVNPVAGATLQVPLRLRGGADADMFPAQKIVVRPSPDVVVAAIVLRGSSVAFYRPGAPSWSSPFPCPPSDGWGRRRGLYVDIAFHRGKLYALSDEDWLFVHGKAAGGATAGAPPPPATSHVVVERAIKPQQLPPETALNPEEVLMTRRYLAVSCAGKLLMVKWMVPVHRRPCERPLSPKVTGEVKLKVFEADLEAGRWVEVNRLGSGEALFVGRGCSKAVRLSGGGHGLRENCVYVLGHDFFGHCYDAMPSYGFYDLKDGTIREVNLDRMRFVWPVSRMDWFFPLENKGII